MDKSSDKDKSFQKKKNLLDLDYNDFVDKFYQGSTPESESDVASEPVKSLSKQQSSASKPSKLPKPIRQKKRIHKELEPLELLNHEIVNSDIQSPNIGKILNSITLDPLDSDNIDHLNVLRKQLEETMIKTIGKYLQGAELFQLDIFSIYSGINGISVEIDDLYYEGKYSTALYLGLELLFLCNILIAGVAELSSFQFTFKELLNIVPQALKKAVPDKEKQLELIWQIYKADKVGFTDSWQEHFAGRYFKKSDWKKLRKPLEEELNVDRKSSPGTTVVYAKDIDEFFLRSYRCMMLSFLYRVYKNSGASDTEILELFHSEINKSDPEFLMADYFKSRGLLEEAVAVTLTGYDKYYQFRDHLQPVLFIDKYEDLISLYFQTNQDLTALAMLFERFFKQPSLFDLQTIKRNCLTLKLWEQTQPYINEFLFNGALPKPSNNQSTNKTWPFPESPVKAFGGIEDEIGEYDRTEEMLLISSFLKSPELLKQIIERENLFKVKSPKPGYFALPDYPRMLEAKYPAFAMKAWKCFIFYFLEEEYSSGNGINKVMSFLKEAKEVFFSEKKENHWKEFIAEIISNHPRKKKLLERLNEEV